MERSPIGDDRRAFRRDVARERETFLRGPRAERRRHLADDFGNRNDLEYKIALSRFDLCEVEDIVDEREQCRALERTICNWRSCSSVSGPGSFINSVPVKPRIALSGVRSSWLIEARN